jgi:hypothetical protein
VGQKLGAGIRESLFSIHLGSLRPFHNGSSDRTVLYERARRAILSGVPNPITAARKKWLILWICPQPNWKSWPTVY